MNGTEAAYTRATRQGAAGERPPSQGGQAAMICVRDVSVVYRRGRTEGVTALHDAALDVGPQEFVSLLGPSGCGKTTLLKVVGGLIKPSSGNVTIKGGSVEDALKERAFGFVFQNASLLPWRKVMGNARLLAEVIGDSGAQQHRVGDLLEKVGLAGFEEHYPDELSGGMQQRVGIVRALAFEPDILLMDEPFAAVDALTRDRLGEILLDVWGSARPVLFVTHSIEEAVFLSDRVIVMTSRPGRVLEDVPIELPRPRVHEMRDDSDFAAVRRHLRRAVDRAQSLAEA